MFKFLTWFPSIVEFIVWIIDKYNSNKVEAKRESVRNDASSEWVDGFGVRREKSDPSLSSNSIK